MSRNYFLVMRSAIIKALYIFTILPLLPDDHRSIGKKLLLLITFNVCSYVAW